MSLPYKRRVRERRLRYAALFFSGFITCAATADEYQSPDGAMSVDIGSGGNGNCEATILFKERNRLISKLSFTSTDHEHGSCVDNAAWTSDGQFFVFSMESAGGHQSWHTPIMFFARKARRVISLENFLPDPVTEPNFLLSPPDVVSFTTTKLPLDETPPQRRSIHLGELKLKDAK
jgi:hypothetical protein